MKSFRQKSCYAFLVILLFYSMISAPLVAIAAEDKGNDDYNQVTLYQITEEVVLKEKVAIAAQTYLFGKEIAEEPDFVYFQFGNDEVKITKSKLKQIDVTEETPIYQEYDEDTAKMVISENERFVDMIDQDIQISFIRETTYPVLQVEEGSIILIGNVAFLLTSKTIDNNVPEEAIDEETGSKENPDEVDTGKPVEVEESKNEEEKESKPKDNFQKENPGSHLNETNLQLDKKVETSWATATSDFFKIVEGKGKQAIYDNRTGNLIKVGELSEGQVYPRISSYGPNWHKIQFGDMYGYVHTENTEVASGEDLKNINTGYTNQERSIIPLENVPVYDNTSGSLVPFGTLQKGMSYPIASDYGNWWRIILSDRVGYVQKDSVKGDFLESDGYFRVITNNLPIYDNRTGKLVKVGELTKGQVYPRISSYGPNWHKIQFGAINGFIATSGTEAASGETIKNEVSNYTIHERGITPLNGTPVYDNTSGKLVEFAVLEAGKSYPKVADYGNWWRVVIAEREGYVSKKAVQHNFLPGDKYFKVITENLPVYDNRGGGLTKVGELQKGQTYPIVKDYGKWWRIQFGEIYGYVNKSGTEYGIKSSIKNLNTLYTNSEDTRIITKGKTTIYDNTSGSLVPFGELEKGIIYPIATDYGNWWRIIYGDRIGYISKSSVEIYGWKYVDYNISLDEAVNKQMGVNPQTDVYNGEIYVRYDAFVSLDLEKLTGVVDSNWRIRSGPGIEYQTIHITSNQRNIKLEDAVEYRDKSGDVWRKLTRSSLPTWINATKDAVAYNMNPANFMADPVQKYQFLDLRHYTGVPTAELDELLSGKGTLSGMGEIFTQAAQNDSINELYLVSHSLLETGNGTSDLARGVIYNGKTVYNLFGVNAFDRCPVECGAEKAYKEGWFTIEDAILGGAKFAKENYIYNGQNTLYKMRWNPDALVFGKPSHQYATDIGWARKQVYYYHRYYSSGNYMLYFEVPDYRN